MSHSLTVIDVVVALVILVSALYAAWRGFLSETLSIFAWAAAAFATLYFGPWLVPVMQGMIARPWLATLAAYAAMFLVVFVPLTLISHRLSRSVRDSAIGPLDRLLGLAFGVARGLALVGLAYLAFTYFTPPARQPASLLRARSLPLLRATGDVILALLPPAHRPPRAEAAGEDRLGTLIRRQEAAAPRRAQTQHSHAAGRSGEKAYGASDRRALDRLLEATGGGGNGGP